MSRGFSALLLWEMGRAEKEKSMPFLVQLSSLWFRTTSSHCRACKRSVLQSLPFSSLLSPSRPAQDIHWQGITLCSEKKREWGEKMSLWDPLKYIVINHDSLGMYVTNGERGQFPQWLVLFRWLDELPLSFYPSVKSLLSLLPWWEIPAIHTLLLGLTQAKQCEGLTQRLLEVRRKMLTDFTGPGETYYVQARGVSSHSCQEVMTWIFKVSPIHLLTLAILWQLQNKQTKVFAVEYGNLENFSWWASACWGCQALPWCTAPSQCQHQHQHPTDLLSTSQKRRPWCLWACLTLVTGQINYNSLPLSSLPLMATACSPGEGGLSKALGVQSQISRA